MSSSSSTKEGSNEDSSSSSSSSATTPQILTRSMVATLIQDLDACDVLECYALVRKAPLQVGSTLNQTLVVSKMALGLRYLPPSNTKNSKQLPKPKLELTLEYGPQRLDNQRESTPLVQHPDATPGSPSSSGSSAASGGDEALFVTWENQGRIYYTTSMSTSHYNGAYYMASLTGAVLESILYKAVEYPTLHGHRRYQPFTVYQRPQQESQQQQQLSPSSSQQQQQPTANTPQPPPRLLLKSSSATDFVREMFHHMAQLGVELQPILAPPMFQLRLWVSAPVEKLQVGVATPAAQFYAHLYQCLHSLVTGDYSHYTPTASPTVSGMPSSMPTMSLAPSRLPTLKNRTGNGSLLPTMLPTSLSLPPSHSPSLKSRNGSLLPTMLPTNVTPMYIDDDDIWFNNLTLHAGTGGKASKNPVVPTSPSNNATNTTNSTAPNNTSNVITDELATPTNTTLTNKTKSNRRLRKRKWHFRLGKVETKNNDSLTSNAPSVAPSAAPSAHQQQQPATPSSSVDTAQKAAEEAKEAAQVAHNAAKQKDEHASATAAEAAATAAQKAADATFSAANQQAREGLLSGDGDLMAHILASTCFSNPQYEITKLPPIEITNTSFLNATNRSNTQTTTTTTPPTTLAYLYIDGSFYYRLKMTSPYIDLVRVQFDMPQATVGGNLLHGKGNGGDILDWALALVIVIAVVVGATITLQAIGFRIYRPLLKWQRRFFHPRKYLNNMDHDDSERGDFDDRAFDVRDDDDDIDDDDENSVDDAIPTSMGGIRRTSWMLRGQTGAAPPSPTKILVASQENDGGNNHIMLDEFVEDPLDHEHDDSANLKVVEMTPLNGTKSLGRNSSHHNGRRRLSSGARNSMSFDDRLRESDVPNRFARDPDLVDLPHLKSKSKVAVPARLVVVGRRRSCDVDPSIDDDDNSNVGGHDLHSIN
jgi:hypothetical protein